MEKRSPELGALIADQLHQDSHRHLLAIPGVGQLTPAKILGETHDARHFPSSAAFAAHAGAAPVPASSGNSTRHRLARGGNRQLNRALFTIARSPDGTPMPAPTSRVNAPSARPQPKLGDA